MYLNAESPASWQAEVTRRGHRNDAAQVDAQSLFGIHFVIV